MSDIATESLPEVYDRRETRIIPGRRVSIVGDPAAEGFEGIVVAVDCQRFPDKPIAVFFGHKVLSPSAEVYKANPYGFPTVQCFSPKKIRIQS